LKYHKKNRSAGIYPVSKENIPGGEGQNGFFKLKSDVFSFETEYR